MGETGKKATAMWAKNPQDRPDAKKKKSEFLAVCTKERNEEGMRKSRNTCKSEWKNL